MPSKGPFNLRLLILICPSQGPRTSSHLPFPLLTQHEWSTAENTNMRTPEHEWSTIMLWRPKMSRSTRGPKWPFPPSSLRMQASTRGCNASATLAAARGGWEKRGGLQTDAACRASCAASGTPQCSGIARSRCSASGTAGRWSPRGSWTLSPDTRWCHSPASRSGPPTPGPRHKGSAPPGGGASP